jgi:hypothetical protein
MEKLNENTIELIELISKRYSMPKEELYKLCISVYDTAFLDGEISGLKQANNLLTH